MPAGGGARWGINSSTKGGCSWGRPALRAMTCCMRGGLEEGGKEGVACREPGGGTETALPLLINFARDGCVL